MPSRREFLQTSAAVSALGAKAVVAGAAPTAGAAQPAKPSRAVYDDRYAAGRRFAAVLAANGVPTRALDAGDITRFWYDELDALRGGEPAPIAGFTQFGPLFVVERLALERGLRLALRVEHRARPDGTLEHSFTGPRETLALAAGCEAFGADWPGLIATLACSVAADESPRRDAALASAEPAPRLAASAAEAASPVHYYTPLAVAQGHGQALDGPLYSWVVAPRARA